MWTRERPTAAGWYWVKWPSHPQYGPEIREVVRPNGPDTDELEVDDMPIDEYVKDCRGVDWQPVEPARDYHTGQAARSLPSETKETAMIQVKWCWDYEAKHLGSYPTTPPYTGHNKPVEIVALSALTEVVRGLKVQGKADEDIPDDKEEAYQYGYWDALTDIQRLLAQLEGHTKGGGDE